MARMLEPQKASRLLPVLIATGLALLLAAAVMLLLSARFQAHDVARDEPLKSESGIHDVARSRI